MELAARTIERDVVVRRLGRVPYDEAHALQKRLVEQRVAGEIPDTLLLLEHPPTITLGRGAKGDGHLLASRDALAARGIEVHEVGRGGDVTYHGPGQLVGYPILDLSPDRRDVRRYVQDLEEIMIRTCAAFGVEAARFPGWNGTWIREDGRDRKIGAVGVRISRWVTMHGFALNVRTDLAQFGLIVPCGIRDKAVTTLALELGARAPALEDARDACEAAFAEVFGARLSIA